MHAHGVVTVVDAQMIGFMQKPAALQKVSANGHVASRRGPLGTCTMHHLTCGKLQAVKTHFDICTWKRSYIQPCMLPCTHLLELHDVQVDQLAVDEYLPLYILSDLCGAGVGGIIE